MGFLDRFGEAAQKYGAGMLHPVGFLAASYDASPGAQALVNKIGQATGFASPDMPGESEASQAEQNILRQRALAAYDQAQAGARNDLAALAQQVFARSRGEGGPSLAELQLQQATDKNVKQGAALLASQRGLSPALAARLALQSQAEANQQAAQQAAILRAQEQQAAQGLAGDMFGNLRTGDINLTDIASRGAQGSYERDLERQLAQFGADREASTRRGTLVGQGINTLGAAAGLPTGGGGVSPYTSGDTTFVNRASGGKIPGQAVVKGDSPKNDKVLAKLSPGEIVIPRSLVEGDDAPEKAALFVAAIKKHMSAGDAKKKAIEGAKK